MCQKHPREKEGCVVSGSLSSLDKWGCNARAGNHLICCNVLFGEQTWEVFRWQQSCLFSRVHLSEVKNRFECPTVLLPAQSQNWLVTLDALSFVLPNGIF